MSDWSIENGDMAYAPAGTKAGRSFARIVQDEYDEKHGKNKTEPYTLIHNRNKMDIWMDIFMTRIRIGRTVEESEKDANIALDVIISKNNELKNSI
jgi:hypothetical protein